VFVVTGWNVLGQTDYQSTNPMISTNQRVSAVSLNYLFVYKDNRKTFVVFFSILFKIFFFFAFQNQRI